MHAAPRALDYTLLLLLLLLLLLSSTRRRNRFCWRELVRRIQNGLSLLLIARVPCFRLQRHRHNEP